jgi:multidrug efflux system outer membrane protein
VNASVGQTAQRVSDNQSATGDGYITRQYTAGLGISAFELDFFGKVKNLSEAALQQYLATEEARRSQQISLVAEVANAWLTLAADQERLRLAQDTLKSQQISYELSKRRFEAGATSGLDMYEAQSSVEAARNEMAVYTAQVAQDRNALTLLVGGAVPDALLPQGELDAVTQTASLPEGLPSDVLRRRPDVLQAERTLRAANANIGAARAAFFPSISLTATAGSASGDLAGLFKGGSAAWSFVPQIRLPIFDGGVNRANLTIAKVDRDIALARYDKAIQSAFRDVADALAQRGTLDERLASQQALADASDKSFRIHEARYQKGAESYLNALVSQRALYAARQSLITARLAKAGNSVTLYKVLGGGWQEEGGQLAAAGGDARAN